jgi:hypothetical protein
MRESPAWTAVDAAISDETAFSFLERPFAGGGPW